MVKSTKRLLGSAELFSDLSDEELERVLAAGRELEFSPGSAIVERGMRASDFYLILDGRASLEVPGLEPIRLGPGDYFGEISVLDGGPRTASVIAGTRVLAFRLGRPEFVSVLDRFGSIGRKILVVVCRRLRQADSRMAAA